MMAQKRRYLFTVGICVAATDPPASGGFLSGIAALLLLLVTSARSQPIELAFPGTGNQMVYYGEVVRALPDLNGDGIGELAIKTSETVRVLGEIGSVYVLSGSNYSVLHRLAPTEARTGFGIFLGDLPDISADKVPEILVASVSTSSVTVYDGAGGQVLHTLKGFGDATTSFGFSMAALSSSKPESRPYLALSSPSCCDARGTHGRIDLFDIVNWDVVLTIAAPGKKLWFGGSMANVGDLDGDGRDDLAVGAGPVDIGTGPGGAYIISGETGDVLRELSVPTPANITRHWKVAAVPDVNGDGKMDVLVGIGGGERAGAPKQSGHAYLFSGASGEVLRALTSPAPRVGGGFGWSVLGVPDVTGDGAGDLLIAAATDRSLGSPYNTFGERKLYLINGATGAVIQSFASPLVGDGFGLAITATLGRKGTLRHPVAGVWREKSGAGRVFAFPVLALAAGKTSKGFEVGLVSTDEADHQLQSSSDLLNWTTVSTLNATQSPPGSTFPADDTARFFRLRRP